MIFIQTLNTLFCLSNSEIGPDNLCCDAERQIKYEEKTGKKKRNEGMSKKVSNSHGAILENPTFIQLVKNLPPYDRTECFLPVHKSLPLVQMLSQIHPIQAPTLILRLILILHNSKTQFLPITPFLQIF